ncbi:MAG: hypothetical protein BWY09_02218 [Candidatus Hydrogenedentes bacterium ADurb.Bin179]|jgi:hypothetical protein|nr:MAG: hypothetical protein BWY09_02218 [Candidatus Hydrogenedentes bacterium ADurb.Bin179]
MTKQTPFKVLIALLTCLASGAAVSQTRIEIPFPDIGEYKTVTADLHMHTVFSDGKVWPTVRVKEAWRNGLDIISITDHLEYLPYKDDVLPKFNRPYEIARPEADKMGLMLLRGVEITRDEPHGHFNAIFLSDCLPLDTPDQKDAVKAAYDQGAFIWWNHPEWKRKDGKAWCEIQQEYLDLGWMHGLEVFNGNSYYVNAHQWALDHNLTLMANTDIHDPIDEVYDYASGEHRTMTLIFVKEQTQEAVKDALMQRRTVAFGMNMLIGREEWLRPLVEKSIVVENPDIRLAGKTPAYVALRNGCAASFDLKLEEHTGGIAATENLSVPAGKTVAIRVQGDGNTPQGAAPVNLTYAVTNALLAPGTPLKIKFALNASFSQ